MTHMRKKLMLAAIAALGAGSLATAGAAQAKHGADDGPHHHRHHHHHHHHHHGADDRR
jgi:Spy/CpxP family protein refolding chaperone